MGFYKNKKKIIRYDDLIS